jgi:hypothetical protein
VAPHGDAANSKEAIARIMRQISANVRSAQFSSQPTVLVLPLIRTAARCDAPELEPQRDDPSLGGSVTGHLWTIAAHESGAHFLDATSDLSARDLGSIPAGGILRERSFVRGVLFVNTCWSELPGADKVDPDVLQKAYQIFGVWNAGFSGSDASQAPTPSPEFTSLCKAFTTATFTGSGVPLD